MTRLADSRVARADQPAGDSDLLRSLLRLKLLTGRAESLPQARFTFTHIRLHVRPLAPAASSRPDMRGRRCS
eukprot:1005620-Rhodomonas_salina.1